MKESKNYKNNFLKKVRKIILFFSFFIFYFLIFKHSFALDIPELNNYVNDFTNTLSQSQKDELSKRLSDFDKKTSNQIVFLMIDSLNGEDTIEGYSIKVAELNKIGAKGKDNGVLFTVVKSDRKLRIEVGYGLEGFLTDGKSSYIIRNIIAPNFKNDDYYLGINNGLNEIIKSSTEANYLNDKISKDNKNDKINPVLGIIIAIIIIFLFIKYPELFLFILFSGGFNGRSGGGFGGGSGGGFSGGGGGFGGGGSSGSW